MTRTQLKLKSVFLAMLMVLSIAAIGFTAPVAAQSADPVVEEEVELSGSTVTIEGGSVSAIGVSGIPEAYYPVKDIGSGTLQKSDNGVIWNTGGTVSFKLTPPKDATPGEKVSFDVKLGANSPQTVTLDVVRPVPDDLPTSISSGQYFAVAGDNGEIGTFDLVDAIEGASDDGVYNGVEFGTFDFVDIIEWNSDA